MKHYTSLYRDGSKIRCRIRIRGKGYTMNMYIFMRSQTLALYGKINILVYNFPLEIWLFLKPVIQGSISYTQILTFPRTCEGNVWKFKFRKLITFSSSAIHLHGIELLCWRRRETWGGGGGGGAGAPLLDPPLYYQTAPQLKL